MFEKIVGGALDCARYEIKRCEFITQFASNSIDFVYEFGSLINAFATLAGCPAVAVPCGFDQYGRPIGLHIVAPPRQDARALQVAALFEKMSGLDKLLPIAPRPGSVPPAESA